MSTQRIPQKSPRKHPAPVKVHAPKEVAKWVPDHELQMVYILLDKANKGVTSPYKKEFTMEVTNQLNVLICPHHFTWPQVKNKIKHLKAKKSYSGSRASKRASIEDKDVEGFKARLSDMMDDLNNVKESVSRRSCDTSQKYDLVEAVMVRLNSLRTQLDVPSEKYFKAAHYITDPNGVKVVNSMDDATLNEWLLSYI
jgi:hypothetical protein